MAKEQGFCIFCGGTGLSKEHIVPRWMRELLPPSNRPKAFHKVAYMGGPEQRGSMDRPGDYWDQTLRVVCRNCNSGWMGTLQESAQPFLSDLVRGTWPELGQTAQDAIATWAAMTTMVYEFADPPTATVPKWQREHLMNNGSVPPGWLVWIGPAGGPICGGARNHFGAMVITGDMQGLRSVHDFQSTGMVIGNLFIQTLMFTPPGRMLFRQLSADASPVVRIHPSSGSAVHPTGVIDWDMFFDISNGFVESIGLRAHRDPSP